MAPGQLNLFSLEGHVALVTRASSGLGRRTVTVLADVGAFVIGVARCAAASAMARPGGVIVHVSLQDDQPGLDTCRQTLQEIGFLRAYCYRHQDFATALELLTDGKVTGEGWTEIRSLDDGAQAFIDIDQGRAPPKIILATG